MSLMFNSLKSIIFTQLEVGTSLKNLIMAYKIDTSSDVNLMLFEVIRILFPRSTMVEFNATIKMSIVLKTHNQSNIEQLSRCSVKIRHNDKCV